jgi:hypothetical protein
MSLDNHIVQVFSNVIQKKLIVRDAYLEPPVAEHRDAALLEHVRFEVDIEKWRVFRDTGETTRFAYAVGLLLPYNYPPRMTVDWTPIRYNPNIHSFFFNPEGVPVLSARMVQFRVRQGKVVCFGLDVVTE